MPLTEDMTDSFQRRIVQKTIPRDIATNRYEIQANYPMWPLPFFPGSRSSFVVGINRQKPDQSLVRVRVTQVRIATPISMTTAIIT